MKNKKLIKQIGILSLIILGFAVFNYSFYSLSNFLKSYQLLTLVTTFPFSYLTHITKLFIDSLFLGLVT